MFHIGLGIIWDFRLWEFRLSAGNKAEASEEFDFTVNLTAGPIDLQLCINQYFGELK